MQSAWRTGCMVCTTKAVHHFKAVLGRGWSTSEEPCLHLFPRLPTPHARGTPTSPGRRRSHLMLADSGRLDSNSQHLARPQTPENAHNMHPGCSRLLPGHSLRSYLARLRDCRIDTCLRPDESTRGACSAPRSRLLRLGPARHRSAHSSKYLQGSDVQGRACIGADVKACCAHLCVRMAGPCGWRR